MRSWLARVAAVSVAAVLIPLVTATPAQAAPARGDGLTEPIYFVHGFTTSFTGGQDCGNYWATTINAYRSMGATGAMLTVGYYDADTNCSVKIGNNNRDTDLTEVGRQLAWDIYYRYSRYGVSVDAVGHSMGGLIIRAALTGTQKGTSGFPPYIYVEDVVTFSTPHTGTNWALNCYYIWTQCANMVTGSGFLATLGSNPQSAQGTDWTVIGADDDDIVTSGSATGMAAGHKIIYYCCHGLEHGTIYQTTSGTYPLKYWNYYDTAGWRDQSAGPAPVVAGKRGNYYWYLW